MPLLIYIFFIFITIICVISLLKVKTSKYQKHKKQIQNSFNVPPPLLTKEENCGPPVTKTYLDNSNGLHHSSNMYNKVKPD